MVEPIGAAGLVLATLTLPAQIFSSCVLAYTTVSDIRSHGNQFSTLFWLFRLQHTRFLVWGQNFDIYGDGISPEKLSLPVYEMVVSTLVQIKELLEGIDKLRNYYGLTQLPTANSAEPLVSEREIKRQATIVFQVQKSCSVFRKLRWAVSDANKFANLIQYLAQHNDALYEFCPLSQRTAQTKAVDAEALAMAIVDEGWQGVQSLQQALESPQSLPILKSASGTSSHLAAQAGACIQGLRLNASETGPTQLPLMFAPNPSLYLSFRGFIVEDLRSQRRSQAMLPGSSNHGSARALIEWRPYNQRETIGPYKYGLQLGIEVLTRMLKEAPKLSGCRILDCLGYVEDDTQARFGLAFRYPNPFSYDHACVQKTLHDLLQSKGKPFLDDRFRLASFLVESLYEFHSTRWLHKNISSHNLLFFSTDPNLARSDSTSFRLPEPYFTGFAWSRPDEPGAASHKLVDDLANSIYRHPDRQVDQQVMPRFHCAYDIYSLGTVLLEIGTWSPLIGFYKAGQNGVAFRDYLLSRKVPLLGVTMGEKYMVAVRKCLEGRFDGMRYFDIGERDSQDYTLNLQRSFYWEVVKIIKEARL